MIVPLAALLVSCGAGAAPVAAEIHARAEDGSVITPVNLFAQYEPRGRILGTVPDGARVAHFDCRQRRVLWRHKAGCAAGATRRLYGGCDIIGCMMDDTFNPEAFQQALERGSAQLFDNAGVRVLSDDITRAYAWYAEQLARPLASNAEYRQALVAWILAGRP